MPINITATYTLKNLVVYFLKLGAIGFGGPVALVGYMHRDLVENRKWISEDDYKEGLALSQLAPGPLAAQLAIYVGFIHYRLLGATLVGLAFVLPSFIMVIGLGVVYKYYQGISWMQLVFYGIGAAVIGIITISAFRLTKKSIGNDYYLWLIYLVAAITTIATESESILLFLAAGMFNWLIKAARNPNKKATGSHHFLSPMLLQISPEASRSDTLQDIFFFFAKAGAFVFGSGLAIVPFLYGGVVKEYGWLDETEFMDAVAIAMITPGPVVITVGFIGYLTAGLSGAVVAAFATFFPTYLFTIIPAPYFKKYGKRPGIKSFVEGITAAAVGAIAGAVIVLGKRSIVDMPTFIICASVIFLLFQRKKTSEPLLIILAAVIGILLKSY